MSFFRQGPRLRDEMLQGKDLLMLASVIRNSHPECCPCSTSVAGTTKSESNLTSQYHEEHLHSHTRYRIADT